jgi:hypothetical protein
MSRYLAAIACAWAVVALGACNFDGPPGDPITPDGGPCAGVSDECADPNTLRHCPAANAMYTDQTCGWGCLATPNARCGAITPAAGAVSIFDASMLFGVDDVAFKVPVIINASGAIGTAANPTMFHTPTQGIENGIDFQMRTGNGVSVAMFRFKSLSTISVSLVGGNAIALVADGAITINGLVDAEGVCTGATAPTTPGPGGSPGGGKNLDGSGPGQGLRGGANNIGGSGAGHGGAGGKGGPGPGGTAIAGGIVYGDDIISKLVGGSGGGGGGGGGGGLGGGGGGALQMISNTSITISSGGINAGGCGGRSGPAGNDGGGGGGSGGTILLEAPQVILASAVALAVNGGGGGAGNAGNANPASPGTLDRTPATASTGSANGGVGAAADKRDGSDGTNDNGDGGGGGGAIGRIRFNTRSGTATIDPGAILSPNLQDGSTCTQGKATFN